MKSLLLRCKWRNSALLLLFLLFAHSSSARIKAVSLTCEDLTDPMAVGVSQPRLSWVDVADGKDKNQRQTAYQVQVASAKEKLLRATRANPWPATPIAFGGSGCGTSAASPLHGARRLVSIRPFRIQIGWRNGLGLTTRHPCFGKTSR